MWWIWLWNQFLPKMASDWMPFGVKESEKFQRNWFEDIRRRRKGKKVRLRKRPKQLDWDEILSEVAILFSNNSVLSWSLLSPHFVISQFVTPLFRDFGKKKVKKKEKKKISEKKNF